MAKTNGESKVESQELDLEHELPAGEDEASSLGVSEKKAEKSAATDVEKLQLERDALLDRLARQQAEFENTRKRTAKEQHEYREYALTEALRSLLPVLDSFDRALSTADTKAEDFRSGFELIHKQLHDVLAKLGLRAIPAKGEPFDPRLHEAIEMVDTTEAGDHQVLDELQRGYKLKDRLLRPAMVRVARNPKK
jgi:molecular chaperone GrpE